MFEFLFKNLEFQIFSSYNGWGKKMSTMLNKKVENLEFAVSEGAKERREMLLLLKEMKEEKRQEKNMRVVSQVILSGKLVPPPKKGGKP